MMVSTMVLFNGLLIVVLALLYAHQKIRRLSRELQCQEDQLKTLMKDLKALFSADIVFGKSLSELQTQLVSLDNRIEQLENTRHNDSSYPHALKILDMGGDKQEIMDSCHLSNAEAELLKNLHAYRNASLSMTSD